MPCKQHQCEYTGTAYHRQLTIRRTKEEERYGELWAEIELPKLLQSRERGEKQP